MSDWKNVKYQNGKFKTSSGGGGGSSTFAGLDDVSFANLQNGQVPKYNSTTQKWENANESGGGGTITDVEVDGISVVNQQGVAEIPAIPDGLHHYSTTEQIIGTWIDGKPLYEKVFDNGSDMSVSYYGWSSISESASQYKIKSIINCYGVSNDGSFQSSMLAWNDNDTLKFQTPRNNTEGWVRYFIIQYTKTTD